MLFSRASITQLGESLPKLAELAPEFFGGFCGKFEFENAGEVQRPRSSVQKPKQFECPSAIHIGSFAVDGIVYETIEVRS